MIVIAHFIIEGGCLSVSIRRKLYEYAVCGRKHDSHKGIEQGRNKISSIHVDLNMSLFHLCFSEG